MYTEAPSSAIFSKNFVRSKNPLQFLNPIFLKVVCTEHPGRHPGGYCYAFHQNPFQTQILWKSCLFITFIQFVTSILYRARQQHCRALCKTARRFGSWEIRCLNERDDLISHIDSAHPARVYSFFLNKVWWWCWGRGEGGGRGKNDNTRLIRRSVCKYLSSIWIIIFITRVSEGILFHPVCLCVSVYVCHDVCPDDLTMKDWCHTNDILQVHCWGCLVVQVMFHTLMTSLMTPQGHRVCQILKLI